MCCKVWKVSGLPFELAPNERWCFTGACRDDVSQLAINWYRGNQAHLAMYTLRALFLSVTYRDTQRANASGQCTHTRARELLPFGSLENREKDGIFNARLIPFSWSVPCRGKRRFDKSFLTLSCLLSNAQNRQPRQVLERID